MAGYCKWQSTRPRIGASGLFVVTRHLIIGIMQAHPNFHAWSDRHLFWVCRYETYWFNIDYLRMIIEYVTMSYAWEKMVLQVIWCIHSPPVDVYIRIHWSESCLLKGDSTKKLCPLHKLYEVNLVNVLKRLQYSDNEERYTYHESNLNRISTHCGNSKSILDQPYIPGRWESTSKCRH